MTDLLKKSVIRCFVRFYLFYTVSLCAVSVVPVHLWNMIDYIPHVGGSVNLTGKLAYHMGSKPTQEHRECNLILASDNFLLEQKMIRRVPELLVAFGF